MTLEVYYWIGIIMAVVGTYCTMPDVSIIRKYTGDSAFKSNLTHCITWAVMSAIWPVTVGLAALLFVTTYVSIWRDAKGRDRRERIVAELRAKEQLQKNATPRPAAAPFYADQPAGG